jgi:competence protein ComEC
MGSVPWPEGAFGAVLLAVLSIVAVLSGPWLLHHSRRKPVVFIAVGVLAGASALPTRLVTWPLPTWQLVACDVGQGDGLVLRSGATSAVVVDVGPDPDVIDGCLSRLGVRVIDAVVLTHFHADHVDGLPGALRGRQVRQILATPVQDPPFQWEEVRHWAAEAHVPLAAVYAGDVLSWPGISARVWWPARVIREGSVPNNASVVMTVDVGALRVAMLGDVEREAAHQVLLAMRREGLTLARGLDVVKVAHHGSANRDDDLLSALRAPVALISVGADNDYGHPAPSTLTALRAEGSTVSRTDEDGDIAVAKKADGTVLVAPRH